MWLPGMRPRDTAIGPRRIADHEMEPSGEDRGERVLEESCPQTVAAFAVQSHEPREQVPK
jgi:hypothetical protein